MGKLVNFHLGASGWAVGTSVYSLTNPEIIELAKDYVPDLIFETVENLLFNLTGALEKARPGLGAFILLLLFASV